MVFGGPPGVFWSGADRIWRIVSGIVTLLSGAVTTFVVMCRRTDQDDSGSCAEDNQFEELARLTGELAHEIKNPLSTIKVNLQLTAEDMEASASDSTDPAESRRYIGRALRKIAVVRKETDRLEQILDSFLRYVARPELQPVNMDVNELIGDMVDFYAPQAQGHAITLRQQLCEEDLRCRVDADMFKQVILNLFINAQQAMAEGGELMVRTQKQQSRAVITVSDTGPGIAEDARLRIFDAYYSTRLDGTGLGLSTARKIMKAHQGSIDVQSEPGKGTSFTIELPLEAR